MSMGGHVGGQKSCPKGSGGFYVGGAHGGLEDLSMGVRWVLCGLPMGG